MMHQFLLRLIGYLSTTETLRSSWSQRCEMIHLWFRGWVTFHQLRWSTFSYGYQDWQDEYVQGQVIKHSLVRGGDKNEQPRSGSLLMFVQTLECLLLQFGLFGQAGAMLFRTWHYITGPKMCVSIRFEESYCAGLFGNQHSWKLLKWTGLAHEARIYFKMWGGLWNIIMLHLLGAIRGFKGLVCRI